MSTTDSDVEPLAARAAHLDSASPLSRFRDRFHLPPGVIYLDGNSLGLLCRDAEESLLDALDQWRKRGIGGWSSDNGWFDLAERAGALMAPLLGAAEEEVIAANSTSVNLHQILATLYLPEGGRTRILVDSGAFPSDLYALESHLRLRGLDPSTHLRKVPPEPSGFLSEDRIIEALGDSIALALLPAVVYTTGQLMDMPLLCATANRCGAMIGFDCSHAIGIVPLHLPEWGADFAIWCGYKYLNGGPGAAAGLFLHRRHLPAAPGLAGWFGSEKDRQFDMSPRMTPAKTAGALQIGSPNVLSMSPLLGALRVIHEAGIDAIRERSLALTEFLMEAAERKLARFGFDFANPRERERRGGHVALRHPEAMRICQALIAAGVAPDHRPPDLIRLCPSPLYNTFGECEMAVMRMERIMETSEWERQPRERGRIT